MIALLVSALLVFSCPVYALDYKYQERVLRHAALHVRLKTPYVWGGTDCSGTIHKIYFDSGVPVLRSTAYNMSRGLEGWKGREVDRTDSLPTDIVFWNVLSYKPTMGKLSKGHPHVGLKTSRSTIGHASAGRKHFLEDEFDGSWGRQIEIIRRLSHGDKK